MLVGKSSAFKNSPHVVHRVFCLSARQSFPCLLLSSWTAASFCHFVSYLVFSHLLSPPFHSLRHMQMLQNMIMHSYFISLSHTHIFLVHFLCWACSVWLSFYILIQNMLNSVYLKLQLFKHCKQSLWEAGGEQGMRLKAAGDGLCLAHLPLPTKPHV